MASPPDERIPRPDQNFISRGLAREKEREANGKESGEGAKAENGVDGGENGDASGAFIGAKELVKRPVSRYCLFFSAVARGVGEVQRRGRTEKFRAR